MRALLAVLFLFLWMLPIRAQDNVAEPLVVPFTTIPPFMQIGANGERSGFIVELSEMIGEEIGVAISYREVSNTREFVGAQISGETQMIAGIPQLPPLAATNVFSDQVAADTLRPTVLAERIDEFEDGPLEGKRIGIVPPAVGSEEPILDTNIPIEFESPQAATMALLAGDLDAMLLPPPVVYGLSRKAGVDGRIAFVGTPLRSATRHVALHESRADLLEQINDAIAKFEADGRLEALRLRYSISVPPPPPEILEVGITHLPPISIVGEDGQFSGFNVDFIRTVAKRADLKIELKPLPVTEWVKGPVANDMDLISALVITDDRRDQMDFSYPILERFIGLVVPSGSQISASRFADLAGFRVGTIEGSVFANKADATGAFEVIPYKTNAELIAALLGDALDVAIIAPTIAKNEIALANGQDALRLMLLEGETIDTALALRHGLGAVREQLNSVIPGFLLSDEYAVMREKYFGDPMFWTKARLYWVSGVVAAIFVALLGSLTWQELKRRRRELERKEVELAREQAHSEQLSNLITDLERSNRELDEFAYIASHDLKEPLRGIGINANFLMREGLEGKARERVLRMSELSGRMEQLISDLLFFSRLGRTAHAREIVEPKMVVEAIRADLAEWLREQGGEIAEVGLIPSLHADRVKVKTVLQNLIINGIKFNRSDKRIVEVSFAAESNVNGKSLRDVIVVKDNGIGIDEKHHDKVFRIFSRLNPRADFDSSAGIGTGSGLAFVRKIVEEHGGVIEFTSVPGKGSTFFVTLPLWKNAAQIN